jgi:hypothetical protein
MHIQAVMMKHAKYDASATMYLDWIAYTDDSSFKAHIEQTETLHVATNFDFNTSVFDDTTIAKSVLLTTSTGQKLAVLSLMDPEHIHAGNPTYAGTTATDYERALNTEIALLQISGARPELVVCRLSPLPFDVCSPNVELKTNVHERRSSCMRIKVSMQSIDIDAMRHPV